MQKKPVFYQTEKNLPVMQKVVLGDLNVKRHLTLMVMVRLIQALKKIIYLAYLITDACRDNDRGLFEFIIIEGKKGPTTDKTASFLNKIENRVKTNKVKK